MDFYVELIAELGGDFAVVIMFVALYFAAKGYY